MKTPSNEIHTSLLLREIEARAEREMNLSKFAMQDKSKTFFPKILNKKNMNETEEKMAET